MPMLQIGSVSFTTTGPHYDKLKHAFKATWARQKRFGRRDALQWTGEGEEDVHVSGAIYPEYFAGFDALAELRAMSRRPQMLVSGAGDVFGRWCIVSLSNEQTLHDAAGVPRKVTFEIALSRYGEDDFLGDIVGLVDQFAGGLQGISATGVDVGANVGGLARLF